MKNSRLIDKAKSFSMQSYLSLICLLFSLLILSACGSSQSKPALAITSKSSSKPLEITIIADSNINPSPTGNPAPLTIDLYTLKSLGTFERVDFFQLKEDGSSLLADDLVDRRRVAIHPGETKIIVLKANEPGLQIGVAAAYRAIDSAKWRAGIPVDDSTNFIVRAGRAVISLQKLEK